MSDWQWKRYWASSLGSALTVAQVVLWLLLGGGPVRWLVLCGVALWCVGVVFAWLPIIQFKRQGGVAKGDSYVKTTVLVDSGIYAIVRHPQFVSWPMFAVALMLMVQHWVVVVLGVASIALYVTDFRKVDALAVERFGEPYREYMARVPGWNPIAGVWRLLRRGAVRP